MPRSCWRALAALLALALAVPAVQAQELLPMPGCCAKEVTCGSQRTVENHMVQKTYPVGPLLHTFGCCPACPELLIKFMTQAVAPESWSVHGGQGTMNFCPMRMALIVRQTPKVHKQVAILLKGMDQMASACAGPMSLMPVGMPVPPPPVPPPTSLHAPEPKQHFRFVLDNLRIRMDDKVITTIKHVEVEYAGDGIDADVAKCAITLGESEKKGEKDKGEAGAAAGAAIGAVSGGLTGNAVDKAEKPAKENAETKAEVKSEEKSDKANVKKAEEEEDHED
jgi:hypothetical protein